MSQTNEFRAQRAGALPQAGAATVASISLPQGRLVRPDPEYSPKAGPEPVLWVTERPVGGLRALFGGGVGAQWTKLAAAFSATGLWPLVLEDLSGEDGRPWLSGELDPSGLSDPSSHDVRAILEKHWEGALPLDGDEPDEAGMEMLAPFGRAFPGLAAAAGKEVAPDAPAKVAAKLEGRLGLVAVTRPADAVARLGWIGAGNHLDDVAELSAVLRSWEERFGAYVVGLGFGTMVFGVRRPPETQEHALALAAEHTAMCPDQIYQGAESMDLYARSLVGNPRWSFWWD